MTLQDKIQISLNVTFVGVVVVFLVLTLLILIIDIFARILHHSSKPDDTRGNGIEQADADQPENDGDEASGESVSQLTDGDEPGPELMAVIMATLSIAMGQAGFRLRSIRRTGRKTSAWNLSGRDEYLATRL